MWSLLAVALRDGGSVNLALLLLTRSAITDPLCYYRAATVRECPMALRATKGDENGREPR